MENVVRAANLYLWVLNNINPMAINQIKGVPIDCLEIVSVFVRLCIDYVSRHDANELSQTVIYHIFSIKNALKFKTIQVKIIVKQATQNDKQLILFFKRLNKNNLMYQTQSQKHI